MKRLASVIGFLAMLALVASNSAEAGRYTCKAAQNLARVAASDRDAVVTEPDENRKECRFSVNGEPAGSPPREAILRSFAVLRQGRPAEELETKKVDWLALALLAASREDGPNELLLRLLSAHSRELSRCFRALELSQWKDVPTFNNNRDLFCRGVAPGGSQFSFEGKYWIEMVSPVPHLVVGARRGDAASYLFVPALFRPR